MFDPFHKRAASIVSTVNRPSIRIGILELGEYKKAAREMERLLHLGYVTTNHWTGPGQGAQTLLTTTFHYIED